MHGHIDAFAQHQVSFAVVDEFSDAAAGEQRHDFPVCVPRYFALQKIQQLCVLVLQSRFYMFGFRNGPKVVTLGPKEVLY